ncbi:type I restriction enzyme HsdR N-terminal domain-containing protein [Campylobacter helveticus]|uniref:type I restriction enzyme HsdR N-terminal domain-containing protein n=1 Tax=Campylobacter helveticus TaxID=28898 RepID=UPI001116CC3F|nr:type I restriction enzyme HsdR N-terminal domain-containing protein [Campylobacter helveticus]TNH32545.1 type I restriction enzyme HsdR N-terminal domain-containing protein [Campylobacter helveticus]TNH34152.1 type I restriction enzyme HsdR N-terminal domain-containing protein [Campylobacter helveticus]
MSNFEQDLLNEGITKKLIAFDENKEFITYYYQDKRRKYTNPEEQVQTIAFLKLVLQYGYPVERIKLFDSVKMGGSTKEADIIVFSDEKCEAPYIVVECKKQDLSDREFGGAVEQAFSYATTELASYVWITSGFKERAKKPCSKKQKRF